MTPGELCDLIERHLAEPKTAQRIYVEVTDELLAQAGSGAGAQPLSTYPTFYDVTAALHQLQYAGRVRVAGTGLLRTYCAVRK